MKVVIVNGSPRKGNTRTAIDAFVKGASVKHEVEVIDSYKVKVGPCMGCNACECHKGCVVKDDTNMVVDKLAAADMIVWASPVYWWGVTAQFKLVLDKCYCRGAQLKGKKIGLLLCGGASIDDPQYELIRNQFACIEKYLGWDCRFFHALSASAKDDLAKDEETLTIMETEGQAL